MIVLASSIPDTYSCYHCIGFFFLLEGKSSSSDSDSSSSHSSDENSPEPPRPEENSPEQQDDETPSKIHFHVRSGNKEACLWTKGSHGLLICKLIFEGNGRTLNVFFISFY